MSEPKPYARAFLLSALWFIASGIKMVSNHPGPWQSFPLRNLAVLAVAAFAAASLLGALASRFRTLRAWWILGVGTLTGLLAVLGGMLLIANRVYAQAAPRSFRSTDEMMVHLANEATKWVRADRGIDLDYSFESIRVIEEELARISATVDRKHPQRGTAGLAASYGAYVGEVFRRRLGGSWASDDSVGGKQSYPLFTPSNGVIFPVGWCWKRLTVGAEENVHHKALVFAQPVSALTNSNSLPAALPAGEPRKPTEPDP